MKKLTQNRLVCGHRRTISDKWGVYDVCWLAPGHDGPHASYRWPSGAGMTALLAAANMVDAPPPMWDDDGKRV